MTTWNRDKVEQHSIYGRKVRANRIYQMWRELKYTNAPVCRLWRRAYINFATDVLNELGEPVGQSIRRKTPNYDYEPGNILWSNDTMQAVQRGRPSGGLISTRPSSFNSSRPDGKLEINGKLYANQYQYKKYWKYRKFQKNGKMLIEGVDFYLDREGYLMEGCDTKGERQL